MYFTLLSKIDKNVPLKVFVTSRPSPDLERLFTRLPVIVEQASIDDTRSDIYRYVRQWATTLPVASNQEDFTNMIVTKSSGNFLWTALSMEQLQGAYTDEEIHKILAEIPEETELLYLSNIRKMEKAKSKSLAKTILAWVILSLRPLTINELKDAIQPSLSRTVSRDLYTSLNTICCQFVDVDQHARVRIIHDTARAFLLSSSLESEFRVQLSDGHLMLARACLKFLLGLKFPKRRSSAGLDTPPTVQPSVAEYACLHFSEHLLRASASSDELFKDLSDFFDLAVLHWIEYLAQLRELGCLVRASAHLKHYLNRRAKHVPLAPATLRAWAIDLPRIATQFGVNLLSCPSSIHNLVPPLCPRESAIFQRYAGALGTFALRGLSDTNWSDRISCMTNRDTMATALACMDQKFAIALSDGTIILYHTTTCKHLLELHHGESVRVLHFGTVAKYLASSGLKFVRLWDTYTGAQLFKIDTKAQCLALAFNEQGTKLIGAMRSKELVYWNTTDGSQDTHLKWMDTSSEGREVIIPRTPQAVKISIEQGIMAVVYRSMPVQLWSLERQRPSGVCTRPTINHDSAIHAAVLNPNPDYPWLAVSYWDSIVYLFDVYTQRVLADVSADLQTMAASPDGKFLAGGDSSGSIQVYDFETLQLLYRIQVHGDPVVGLAITTDSLRILDIRAMQTNVWAPSVLVGYDNEAAASSEPASKPGPQSAVEAGNPVQEPMANITAMHCCDLTNRAFIGRSDGHVDTCSLENPEDTLEKLYKHRTSWTSITCVVWSPVSHILVTVDSSSRYRAMRLTHPTETSKKWEVECLLDEQLGQAAAINQVLLSPNGLSLLVSSLRMDLLWDLEQKSKITESTNHNRKCCKWFHHNLPQSELLLYEDGTIKRCGWESLETYDTCFGDVETITTGIPDMSNMVMDWKREALISSLKLDQTNVMYSINVSTPATSIENSDTTPEVRTPTLFAEIPELDSVLGIITLYASQSLVYITTSGWVCSIDLSEDIPESFQRHFFIPSVWLSQNNALIAAIMVNQNVVIVHDGEIVVIECGFTNVGDVSLGANHAFTTMDTTFHPPEPALQDIVDVATEYGEAVDATMKDGEAVHATMKDGEVVDATMKDGEAGNAKATYDTEHMVIDVDTVRPTSSYRTLFNSMRATVSDALVAIGYLEPPLRPGYARLRWQCVSRVRTLALDQYDSFLYKS